MNNQYATTTRSTTKLVLLMFLQRPCLWGNKGRLADWGKNTVRLQDYKQTTRIPNMQVRIPVEDIHWGFKGKPKENCPFRGGDKGPFKKTVHILSSPPENENQQRAIQTDPRVVSQVKGTLAGLQSSRALSTDSSPPPQSARG